MLHLHILLYYSLISCSCCLGAKDWPCRDRVDNTLSAVPETVLLLWRATWEHRLRLDVQTLRDMHLLWAFPYILLKRRTSHLLSPTYWEDVDGDWDIYDEDDRPSRKPTSGTKRKEKAGAQRMTGEAESRLRQLWTTRASRTVDWLEAMHSDSRQRAVYDHAMLRHYGLAYSVPLNGQPPLVRLPAGFKLPANFLSFLQPLIVSKLRELPDSLDLRRMIELARSIIAALEASCRRAVSLNYGHYHDNNHDKDDLQSVSSRLKSQLLELSRLQFQGIKVDNSQILVQPHLTTDLVLLARLAVDWHIFTPTSSSPNSDNLSSINTNNPASPNDANSQDRDDVIPVPEDPRGMLQWAMDTQQWAILGGLTARSWTAFTLVGVLMCIFPPENADEIYVVMLCVLLNNVAQSASLMAVGHAHYNGGFAFLRLQR
jgi:hypothetical protein